MLNFVPVQDYIHLISQWFQINLWHRLEMLQTFHCELLIRTGLESFGVINHMQSMYIHLYSILSVAFCWHCNLGMLVLRYSKTVYIWKLCNYVGLEVILPFLIFLSKVLIGALPLCLNWRKHIVYSYKWKYSLVFQWVVKSHLEGWLSKSLEKIIAVVIIN